MDEAANQPETPADVMEINSTDTDDSGPTSFPSKVKEWKFWISEVDIQLLAILIVCSSISDSSHGIAGFRAFGCSNGKSKDNGVADSRSQSRQEEKTPNVAKKWNFQVF